MQLVDTQESFFVVILGIIGFAGFLKYGTEEGSYILERDKINKESKSSKLDYNIAKRILMEDGFENWDFEQSFDLDELIDMVDGGYGILSEDE